jgi:hypothetical protein
MPSGIRPPRKSSTAAPRALRRARHGARASSPCRCSNTGVYYAGKLNGVVELRIANILGFFIDRVDGSEVIGYFTEVPGLVVGNNGLNIEAAFMKTVQLVR